MTQTAPPVASTPTSTPSTSTAASPIAIAEHDVGVLDSHLHYREAGQGDGPVVVFLHGNPTSSYVWRKVLPKVAPHARCVAPDLIGMGGSGKPTSDYRFVDHARYLDAFFEALELRDVVLVGYDWGGALGLHWAERHPERVRGLVLFETFLRPMEWSEWPPVGAELFQKLRTKGVGEAMVLERNEFLARSLENGVKHGLREEDKSVYYAPYPDSASRLPLLQWPREIPVGGEPADVAAIVTSYGTWLGHSPTVPKLLLTFDSPTPMASAKVVDWAKQSFDALEVEPMGAGGHHAPEDRGEDLGQTIAAWLARHSLRGRN
jgi:haloalkane dehalogenase